MQFSREDWTLFRSLNTLPQKAGVSLGLLGALVVKELVDNALDAGANVKVREDGDYVIIEDDGPGIDHEQIATLFSIRRPLTSSKIIRLPQRGALGNGLRVVMGAVYASKGNIVVETGGHDDDMTEFVLKPQDDGHTVILNKAPSIYPRGTRIRLRLGKALQDVEHVKLTALSKLSIAFAKYGTLFKGKTSPWWYDGEAFFEMCHAAGDSHLNQLLKVFRDIGQQEGDLICEKLNVDFAKAITRDEAERLLLVLRELSKAPKPSVLGKIDELADYHRAVVTGTINVGQNPRAELPYVIECFARPIDGDPNAAKDEKDVVLFMVNRTRVAGRMDIYRSKPARVAIHGCGLHHAFEVPKNVPLQLLVNITTPYMPITTDGKEPDLSQYVSPLNDAIKRAANKCKRAVRAVQGETKLSQKDYIIHHLDEAIEKASTGGKYRFSLRQLFYAVRPFLLDVFPEGLNYNYFGSVITEVEGEQGYDIRGMYRDPRGKIYHPHTREEIPLGTINVEEYERPAWTFNKILYIEKGGFFPLLTDVNWPERNDCALMTSQGFASRAARDVLDLLGDSQEDIYFFCIHDADAAGTMIYQSLMEATKARGKRRVHVVNLGLDPEEARDMGLQVEEYREAGGKRLPVADYLGYQDAKWLQTRRVELNAMTSEEFLQWLDEKFEQYAGKIVPPKEVLEETFLTQGKEAVRKHLTDKILREGDFETRSVLLEPQLTKLAAKIDLDSLVRDSITVAPEERWDAPINRKADETAQTVVTKEKKK